ncbi:type IV pilus assembly protein PilV [Polaromonas sp. CG_9.5]|nr:type IV pilus assembly protein PilV [Polaromonas sp. CG_9.5]
MIEVLVTIVIVAFGLLGMAGLQSRMQVSEMEAYQRAQALVLLNDMAERIAINRTVAASYVTVSALGAGLTPCPAVASGQTLQQIDAREWCNALQGAAEAIGTNKRGAMLGGRGCVESLGNNEYMITVAWQGLIPLTAPLASVACGQNQYNEAGSACINDLCRRTVTTVIRIAALI